MRCQAFFVTDTFSMRIDNISEFQTINRTISSGKTNFRQLDQIEQDERSDKSTSIGRDCVVAKSVKMGSGTVIKKSIIGDYCNIGENVRIVDSIILENVNISSGCDLLNCVVVNDLQIGEGSVLRNYLVENKVPPKTNKLK